MASVILVTVYGYTVGFLVYKDPYSGSDDPVSGSEDPNPVSRICIPVLSMRILDSCSIDPEFLVLRIWMPVLIPGFRFQRSLFCGLVFSFGFGFCVLDMVSDS